MMSSDVTPSTRPSAAATLTRLILGCSAILWATLLRSVMLCSALLLSSWLAPAAVADDVGGNGNGNGNEASTPTDRRRGTLIDVALPMSPTDAASLLATLRPRVDAAQGDLIRPTVVLRLIDRDASENPFGSTDFEDALRVARSITSDSWRSVRWVVWVDTVVDDHAALLLTAGEQILMSDLARIDRLSGDTDETIAINYRALAARRGVLPEPLVDAIVSPVQTLARVTLADGGTQLAAGDTLDGLRRSGRIVRSETWAEPTDPLSVGSDQLLSAAIISAVVNDAGEVARRLDLASLNSVDSTTPRDPVAARLEIAGPISTSRVRRFRANLAGIGDEVNTLVIAIDSSGGDRDASAGLAATLVDPPAGVAQTVGVVTGEAIGDAALIAMTCKPLYMLPSGRLGGSGSDAFSADQPVDPELVRLIADRTGRSIGLIDGLLQRTEIHQFSDPRTGAVAFGTLQSIAADAGDPDAEADRWTRGEAIDFRGGIDAATAVRLGLVDAIVDSTAEAAAAAGLPNVPPAIRDRPLVRFIERIGANGLFSFLLVSIGLMALSGEMNAPGLGFPGFIAMMCFALFFWTKFLNGTAEWFELIVLVLGLICIAIELFVVPGVGIFGIGGLLLTVLGIVLMSQTFIIPENQYQLGVLARSVWSALGGVIAMVIAFVLVRTFLPSIPIFGGLVMESVDGQYIDQHERLGNYDHFLDRSGVASTLMRPSGKITIDDQLIAAVSDGSLIQRGDPIRVCEVHGTRVVVEPIDPESTT